MSARELISAAVDDELPPAERRILDEHLEECPLCRGYAERVSALTRAVRLRGVEPIPDLTARVFDRARPPRLGRGGWLRPALAWVALVIAAQSVQPLVLGDAGTTLLSAVLDVTDQVRTPLAEAVHLTELLGLVLLWMIAGSPGWERLTNRVGQPLRR